MLNGGRLRAVVRDRSDLRWSLSKRAEAGYLGWTNRGNLGDEAMCLAARDVCGPTLRRVPLHGPGRLLATGGRCRVLLVGGGTLLGRPEWLERAIQAQKVLRPERTIVMGTGVEPLDFGNIRGTTSLSSAASTSDFLRSCDYVGVRGPHSRDELARNGVDADVVGDPALSLRTAAGRAGSRSGMIAVNLAAVSDGLDPTRVRTTREIMRCAAILTSKKWRVVFFSMEPEDERAIRAALQGGSEVLPWADDVPRLLRFIGSADAVLSERLHGGILAAASKVPFVQVGYKPKIHDFADSVGASSWVRSPSELDGEELAEAISYAAIGGLTPNVSQRIDSLADRYRRTLTRELGIGHNDLPGPTVLPSGLNP